MVGIAKFAIPTTGDLLGSLVGWLPGVTEACHLTAPEWRRQKVRIVRTHCTSSAVALNSCFFHIYSGDTSIIYLIYLCLRKSEQKKTDAAVAQNTENGTNNSSAVTSGQRATWTASDNATMIEVLKQQRAAGNQADNNWKHCVWTAVAEEVNKGLPVGGLKTPDKCKDHWTTVSSPFYIM